MCYLYEGVWNGMRLHNSGVEQGIPDCGDKLIHKVQVGLVWYIALGTEDLVVRTLHQLLFQFCSMLDVGFLLYLQATCTTATCGLQEHHKWG